MSPNPDIATNINDNRMDADDLHGQCGQRGEQHRQPGIYISRGRSLRFCRVPAERHLDVLGRGQLAIDNGYIFEWGLNLNPALIRRHHLYAYHGLNADSSYWTGPGIIDQDFDANYCDIILDEPGIYDYTFTVTNNFSCTFDTTLSIEVVEGPENNITAGPDQGFLRRSRSAPGRLRRWWTVSCGASQGTTTYCYGNNENTTWVYCPDNPGTDHEHPVLRRGHLLRSYPGLRWGQHLERPCWWT